jgi:hypothetical protein
MADRRSTYVNKNLSLEGFAGRPNFFGGLPRAAAGLGLAGGFCGGFIWAGAAGAGEKEYRKQQERAGVTRMTDDGKSLIVPVAGQ